MQTTTTAAKRGRRANRSVRVWGHGSFENDAAMGWVESLEDAPDIDLVEATLDEVLEVEASGDEPDPGDASRAIAAAETVAALADQPGEALPEEVRQWCFDNPGLELTEVQPKAVQALGVILQASALRDLFEEHGYAEDWELEVEGLIDRLRAR